MVIPTTATTRTKSSFWTCKPLRSTVVWVGSHFVQMFPRIGSSTLEPLTRQCPQSRKQPRIEEGPKWTTSRWAEMEWQGTFPAPIRLEPWCHHWKPTTWILTWKEVSKMVSQALILCFRRSKAQAQSPRVKGPAWWVNTTMQYPTRMTSTTLASWFMGVRWPLVHIPFQTTQQLAPHGQISRRRANYFCFFDQV